MRCIKQLAIQEPLIDVVDPKQVMSTSARILTIDINTVKEEDLSFTVPFRLVATRDDFCHAFVISWDIDFMKCLKRVSFSTAPGTPYTHWKQTVFYLNEVLSVKKGEEIKGEFMCKPNEKNPRDLDISISYKFRGEYDQIEDKQFYCLR